MSPSRLPRLLLAPRAVAPDLEVDVRVDLADHAHLVVRGEGDTLRVVVTGELDLASRDGLRAARRWTAAGHHPVVVDLSGVSFVDVQGLEGLVEAVGRGRVCATSPCVDRMVQLLDSAHCLPRACTGWRRPSA